MSSPPEPAFSFAALKERFESQSQSQSSTAPTTRVESPVAERTRLNHSSKSSFSSSGFKTPIVCKSGTNVVEINGRRNGSNGSKVDEGTLVQGGIQKPRLDEALGPLEGGLIAASDMANLDVVLGEVDWEGIEIKEVGNNTMLNEVILVDRTLSESPESSRDAFQETSSSTVIISAPPLVPISSRPILVPTSRRTAPPIPISRAISRPSRSTSYDSDSTSPSTPEISKEVRADLPPVPPRPSSSLIDGRSVAPPFRTRSSSVSVLSPPPRLPDRIVSPGMNRQGSATSLPLIPSSAHTPLVSASSSPSIPSAFVSTLPPPPRKTMITKSISPVIRPASPLSAAPISTSPALPESPIPRRNGFAPPRPIPRAATEPIPNSTSTPYLPPPPPSRAIAAHERLAPQRSNVIADLDSSDDDADDTSNGGGVGNSGGGNKSSECPDSTFASRRVPTLRTRTGIPAHGHIYSMTMRGNTVVTGQHSVHVWNSTSIGTDKDSSYASSSMTLAAEPILSANLVPKLIPLGGAEHKIHAVEFKPSSLTAPEDDARFLWVGNKEGDLFEVDILQQRIVYHRAQIHPQALFAIFRLGRSMLTLDESGKLLIWGSADSQDAFDLTVTPRAQRVVMSSSSTSTSSGSDTFAALLGDQLWTSTGPIGGASRNASIRVYDPTGKKTFTLTPRPLVLPDSSTISYGPVTSGTIIPSSPSLVYLGHTSGYVSIWSVETFLCVGVQKLSPSGITSIAGVTNCLWVGLKTGMIGVYRIEGEEWKALKVWKAHKDAVTKLLVDSSALDSDNSLPVASLGGSDAIKLWDGLLREDWLDQELRLRQNEYCTFRTIKTLVISWNIDATTPAHLAGSPQNTEFLAQALASVDSPDIIVFGFQEVIDLEHKGLTAKTMLFGNKLVSDQKLSNAVSHNYNSWNNHLVHTVMLNMQPECPYSEVFVGDMVGLFSCIFVKSAERDALRDVAMINCKTGMGGRYGNKGALLSRFVIDDTSICFINVHLAAGQRHRAERDSDLADILELKSSFSSLASSSPGAYSVEGGTNVFDHEICVLSGDLNYRIDQIRESVISAVARNDLNALLANDQLLKGLKNNPLFRLRSFKEAPITFAPTYKYDRGTQNYDSSSKQRIPAWCDRVLYRAEGSDIVTSLNYQRYECNVSDHRPISAGFAFKIKSILPEQRERVWKEVEKAWLSVEMELLREAKEYYSIRVEQEIG